MSHAWVYCYLLFLHRRGRIWIVLSDRPCTGLQIQLGSLPRRLFRWRWRLWGRRAHVLRGGPSSPPPISRSLPIIVPSCISKNKNEQILRTTVTPSITPDQILRTTVTPSITLRSAATTWSLCHPQSTQQRNGGKKGNGAPAGIPPTGPPPQPTRCRMPCVTVSVPNNSALLKERHGTVECKEKTVGKHCMRDTVPVRNLVTMKPLKGVRAERRPKSSRRSFLPTELQRLCFSRFST